MTKNAGCHSAVDRVIVENNIRPRYMEYVSLNANAGHYANGSFNHGAAIYPGCGAQVYERGLVGGGEQHKCANGSHFNCPGGTRDCHDNSPKYCGR